MINRIVRLSFDAEKIDEFLKVFNESKDKIIACEGCEGLSLLRDSGNKNVFFTYSFWRDEHCLNKYRFSELFKSTWAKTKILFNDKPQAWSLLVEQKVK